MKPTSISTSLLGALLLLTLSSTAQATLIEITYAGMTTSVDSELTGTFAVDQAVAGTIVYDTAALPTVISTTRSIFGSAIQSYVLTIGSYTGSSTAGSANIHNDDPGGFGDAAGFVSATELTGDPVGGLSLSRLQFYLNTTTLLSTLVDLDLPFVSDLDELWAANIAAGNINFMQFDTSKEVRYTLTDFSARNLPFAVSEPTTLALLALGLAGIGFRRNRERSNPTDK